MYSYSYDLRTPYGPVMGPYDDPDYVANMTAGPYRDEDDDDEPYLGPFAVYDP